jgi:DNA repair exonuclease SbcCD ATPase subunit
LQAENVKKIRAIDITPPEYVVTVTGKNAAGKTSALDSIWLTLDNRAAEKRNVRPIREGADEAMAVLDFGELVVTRKWTSNSTSYLTVATKDGAEYKAPQTLLNTMMSPISLDPLAFMRSSSKEQAETLLAIAGITIDDLDQKRQEMYTERTIVNREIKRLESRYLAAPEHEGITRVDKSAIVEKIQIWQREIAKNQELRNNIANKAERIRQLEDELEAAMARVIALKDSLGKERIELETLKKTDCEDPDIGKLEEQLAQAEEINRKADENAQKEELRKALENVKARSKKLTETIARIDKEKAERFANAKLPIAGLGVDETGVTFNGVPLNQCSSAEQLKISLAIAMAGDPKIRVIRITDGSLLDSESMKYLEKVAIEKDFQVWIEKVDESGIGIYIEDGEVK